MDNGFAFTVDEFDDLHAFIDNLDELEFEVYSTPHSRRTKLEDISFQVNGNVLEMSYDLENMGIKYCTVNEACVEKPMIYADGLNVNKHLSVSLQNEP